MPEITKETIATFARFLDGKIADGMMRTDGNYGCQVGGVPTDCFRADGSESNVYCCTLGWASEFFQIRPSDLTRKLRLKTSWIIDLSDASLFEEAAELLIEALTEAYVD